MLCVVNYNNRIIQIPYWTNRIRPGAINGAHRSIRGSERTSLDCEKSTGRVNGFMAPRELRPKRRGGGTINHFRKVNFWIYLLTKDFLCVHFYGPQ